MLIDLSELFPYEEKRKEYTVSYDLDLADGYEVTKSDSFVLSLIHHKNHMLDIEGSGEITVSIPCGRCLEPVESIVPFTVDMHVDVAAKTDEDGDDIFFIEGSELDVNDLLIDEIRMNMPMRVLCKEDCRGICFRCGANLNHGSCSCEAEEVPTRMGAALQKAFADAMNKK